MIVYNVDRRFFALKGDANQYRKELGMKTSALVKLVVNDRYDLADLLDGLCAIKPELLTGPEPVDPAKRIEVAPIFDCVPQFIRNSWAKRNQ